MSVARIADRAASRGGCGWLPGAGRQRRQPPGQARAGFTLIEILVAMMVLSIALTVVMQLFSGGLRSARLSQDYTLGVFHAREKMEEILLAPDVSGAAGEGAFDDGYRWQAGVQLIEAPEEESGDLLPVETYLVTVRVSWPIGEKEKFFEINTLKLQTRTEVSG